MTRRAARTGAQQAELERIARERLEASRQVDRSMRLELLRACAEMIGAAVVGMAFVGFALRVDDVRLGEILILTGMFVIVAGVVLSMVAAYRRGEQRGDW